MMKDWFTDYEFDVTCPGTVPPRINLRTNGNDLIAFQYPVCCRAPANAEGWNEYDALFFERCLKVIERCQSVNFADGE